MFDIDPLRGYFAREFGMKQIPAKSLNFITLAIFAPVLIIAGIAGFLIPPEHSLTSGAPAYNVFHLIFGVIGLLVVLTRNELWLSLFNFGFGLIDLYQAMASALHLAPEKHFLWTSVDDILHVLIGVVLVVIGLYGLFKLTASRKEKQT